MSSNEVNPCSIGADIERYFDNGDISLDDFASDKEQCTTKTKDRSKWFVRQLSEKSGSLLYFPHSLAYLCNCGDMDGLAELIKKHFHKKALIHMTGTVSVVLSMSKYISLLSMMNVLLYDSLYCVRSTKVEDNQIISKIYYSYTDVATMYAQAKSTEMDPVFQQVFVGERSVILKRRLKLHKRSAELQAKLLPLVESDDNLRMNCKAKLIITYDERKHKVSKMYYMYKFNSVVHNGEKYRLKPKVVKSSS